MEQLIAGLGFPVACCLGLAAYVKMQNDQIREDNKEDKEMWLNELSYSREVNKEISMKLDKLIEKVGE